MSKIKKKLKIYVDGVGFISLGAFRGDHEGGMSPTHKTEISNLSVLKLIMIVSV